MLLLYAPLISSDWSEHNYPGSPILYPSWIFTQLPSFIPIRSLQWSSNFSFSVWRVSKWTSNCNRMKGCKSPVFFIYSFSISVAQALSQNAELRTRLNRIHSESVLTDQVVSVTIIATPDEVGHRSLSPPNYSCWYKTLIFLCRQGTCSVCFLHLSVALLISVLNDWWALQYTLKVKLKGSLFYAESDIKVNRKKWQIRKRWGLALWHRWTFCNKSCILFSLLFVCLGPVWFLKLSSFWESVNKCCVCLCLPAGRGTDGDPSDSAGL